MHCAGPSRCGTMFRDERSACDGIWPGEKRGERPDPGPRALGFANRQISAGDLPDESGDFVCAHRADDGSALACRIGVGTDRLARTLFASYRPSPNRMDLSVVVVTYHSRPHIAECLRSLDRARGSLAMDVFVVDNASADGTVDEVRAVAPWARVVETGDNLGYSRAVNRGIAESDGEFVLVLNPDCVVAEHALAELHAWMRAHPRCGVAGPLIRNTDGTVEWSARSFPGPLTFLFNRYSLLTRLWPGNPWSRAYLLSDWDHASPRSVDWVSGAAMFVRRAAIAEAGGMDEFYFMFNEDVDWCHCMKDAGWTVDFVPDAQVVHHVGASKGRVADKVILERHRGMIHYFRKHHRANPLVDAIASAFIMTRARLMLAANARRH